MIFDFPPGNFLKFLNTEPRPGTIVDVEVLESGHFLVLFHHWMKLVTYNGEVLSSIKLQKQALSLGRHNTAFVVPCVSNRLCFVKLLDCKLKIYIKIKTEVQFSGACAVTTDSLMCVAQNEPILYIYDGLICVKTIDLTSFGVNVFFRQSFRRIRLNQSGHIVISDYGNNFVLILSNNGTNSVTHSVDCPSSIAACEKYVYIVQDAHENRVLEVRLDDHSEMCILTEEDGIIHPNCVSVTRHGMIMVGMDSREPLARLYQINDEVL